MNAKSFLLGVLAGVMATTLVVLLGIAALGGRPLSQLVPGALAPTGDITVSVKEVYLGRLATQLAREQEPMIHSVAVDVQPGGRVDMTVGLNVTLLNQTLNLQARLINMMRVDDARLRFDLQRIEFAGLDIPSDLLPGSLRATLEAMMADVNDRANRMLASSGLVPLGVTTDGSSIAISLQAQ